QIGSYAMTDAFTWSEDRSASALVTWSLTRDSALPPSRSSSVSPQQMIGTSPFACRACAFLLTVSSVSAKCSRRSEWPTMTYFTPRSSSIAGDTSPVNAPLSSKWLFSAPMPSSEPSVFATSEGRWMNGAQMALSTSSFFGSVPSASMNASPSETVLFIFQLPAINGVLIYILLVSFDYTCSYLSAMTVSPGSSLPSRYSSEAPPPIEIWVNSSAYPSSIAAAAESPPPMIVVALSRSAIVLHTPIVPFANASISNTPIGPFQTTVRAPSSTFLNALMLPSPMSRHSLSAGISSTETVV